MLKLITFFVLCYVCIDVVRSRQWKDMAFSPEIKQLMRNLRSSCMEKTGISESEIIDAADGKLSGSQILKDYMGCEFMELGIVDENGVWDREGHIDMAPDLIKENIKKIAVTCQMKETNAADTSYEIHECYFKLDPSTFFVI